MRYFVQSALLERDEIGWLGFARIAMGYPLWILAIGVSVLIVMRGTGWKRPPLKTLLGKRLSSADLPAHGQNRRKLPVSALPKSARGRDTG